jgi:hypothetical protein
VKPLLLTTRWLRAVESHDCGSADGSENCESTEAVLTHGGNDAWKRQGTCGRHGLPCVHFQLPQWMCPAAAISLPPPAALD